MRVGITGSTGLIGSTLVPLLEQDGHQVTRWVRGQAGQGEVAWDPMASAVDPSSLKGIDAMVHLAGENIAGARWTQRVKQQIRDSRVKGTRVLSEALGTSFPSGSSPSVLVAASAIGFYGDRGDELLDERSAAGTGFLAEVVKQWEGATQPAIDAGVRVVLLRFGVVLSPRGGALAKMLTPFKMGVGGRVGSGRQWCSWITVDDAARAIRHALLTDSLHGPVNAVAPHPVTNAELTKTLGRVLGRPTILPMPAFAARLALGEMADELLLSSTRVESNRLLESGFDFQQPQLEGALRHLLHSRSRLPDGTSVRSQSRERGPRHGSSQGSDTEHLR